MRGVQEGLKQAKSSQTNRETSGWVQGCPSVHHGSWGQALHLPHLSHHNSLMSKVIIPLTSRSRRKIRGQQPNSNEAAALMMPTTFKPIPRHRPWSAACFQCTSLLAAITLQMHNPSLLCLFAALKGKRVIMISLCCSLWDWTFTRRPNAISDGIAFKGTILWPQPSRGKKANYPHLLCKPSSQKTCFCARMSTQVGNFHCACLSVSRWWHVYIAYYPHFLTRSDVQRQNIHRLKVYRTEQKMEIP